MVPASEIIDRLQQFYEYENLGFINLADKVRRKSPKYENNWRFKTLEFLENNFWSEPEYDSHVVRTAHKLRKIPLNDFAIEDLRIMIGQNIGLKYLIPLGLEALEENILAEGDCYEGDLLHSILKRDFNFWTKYPKHFERLTEIIQKNEFKIQELDPKLFNVLEELKKITNALNKSSKLRCQKR